MLFPAVKFEQVVERAGLAREQPSERQGPSLSELEGMNML